MKVNIPSSARCGRCGRLAKQVQGLVVRGGRIVCVDTRRCKLFRRSRP